MKTKELIKKLQEADPTGEHEVFDSHGNVTDVIPYPWYYDGKPSIVSMDDGGHVLNLREINESDNKKVYLYAMNVGDVMGEYLFNLEKVQGSKEFLDRCETELKNYQEFIRTLKEAFPFA